MYYLRACAIGSATNKSCLSTKRYALCRPQLFRWGGKYYDHGTQTWMGKCRACVAPLAHWRGHLRAARLRV